MRLFVALELPPAVRQHAAAEVAGLKNTGADVKWVHPKSMHLTLKFLGDVEGGLAAELGRELGEALGGFRAPLLRATGCGAFPNPGQPNVVWLGLGGELDSLGRLVRLVENTCESMGFAREKRPFKAHLTLGRLRRPAGRAKPFTGPLTRAIVAAADRQGPEFRADTVALMQSTLTPKGAIYKPLNRFNLG